jgi:hypothetical protein
LKQPINNKYSNLKTVINKDIKYILYGDTSIKDKNHNHHILHCKNLESFTNVKVIYNNHSNMKELRDNGFIKQLIDGIITI